MKKWVRSNIILLLLVLVGVVSAVCMVAGRASIEQQNKSYDIVMDYKSLQEMADSSDQDMDYWLKTFRDLGINKIALFESSIRSLADEADGDFYLKTAKDIKSSYGWQTFYPQEVVDLVTSSEHSTDLLVASSDREKFNWVVDAFESRSENVSYQVVDSGSGDCFLWIYGNENDITGLTWADLPLGLWPETVEQISSYGYDIIPRTTTVDTINGAKFAKAVLQEYSEYNSPYYLPSGDSMLGYDDKKQGTEYLSQYLSEHNIAAGLIENSKQSTNITWPGFNELIAQLDYKAVRAFSMWPYVQGSYAKYNYDGPEEITNCLYRAAYERNCHLIYLKMILDGEDSTEYITDKADYAQLLGDFFQRMDARGYTYETLTPAQKYVPSPVLRFLVGVGAIAACVILLGLFLTLSGKVRYLLLVIGCVCVAGAMYVMPNTSKLILSIGGGIAMPCLAAVGVNRYIQLSWEAHDRSISLGRLLIQALALTLIMTAVSFCGSLFASAPLSESAYILEMNLYRGVKIMQLVPLAVFVVSYLQIFLWEQRLCKRLMSIAPEDHPRRKQARKEAWNRLLDRPVQIRGVFYGILTVLVLAVLGGVGAYYLARTGHTSSTMQASTLELEIRNFLENVLIARPRTKEFLVGYPCMLLMIWSFRRQIPVLPLVFGAGAVIGLTSVVNTFLHIRTPFMLSVIRVLTGLGMGLIVGILALLVAEAIYRAIIRHKRSAHV